jgi:hypothetical protein
MSEDGQSEPGSGCTAHRGEPGAGQARQNASEESPSGDGQDHAGTPRPDALVQHGCPPPLALPIAG